MAIAQKELHAEGLEQKTLTNPDSRRMKNNGAMDICYNVQAAIDGSNHFAIDATVTNDINDLNQLSTMAADAKEQVEPDDMVVIADTGYYNATEIKNCVDADIAVYIKKGKSNNQTQESRYRKDKFTYDLERAVYTCPEGKSQFFFENTSKNGLKYRKFKCTECGNAHRKDYAQPQCLVGRSSGGSMRLF